MWRSGNAGRSLPVAIGEHLTRAAVHSMLASCGHSLVELSENNAREQPRSMSVTSVASTRVSISRCGVRNLTGRAWHQLRRTCNKLAAATRRFVVAHRCFQSDRLGRKRDAQCVAQPDQLFRGKKEKRKDRCALRWYRNAESGFIAHRKACTKKTIIDG